MKKIAVVVPTIRPDSYKTFLKAWEEQFKTHNITLITVHDGENPTVGVCEDQEPIEFAENDSVKTIMGEYSDLIYNLNDGVRNLGFAWVAKYMPEIEVIITLDDDVKPYGDTIQDHLDALDTKVPVSWMATTRWEYTRGFPYGVREEAEVVLSHGVWEGVKDWDAPTQLVKGNPDVIFYRGTIPKGVFYPMCIMNVAFKRKMLPYMYQAPMGPEVGLDRFADIWCGIESKKIIDSKGWAVVTGYSTVLHERASNVFKNLQKEAKGLELNESFWKDEATDPYFKLYEQNRKRWEDFINEKA